MNSKKTKKNLLPKMVLAALLGAFCLHGNADAGTLAARQADPAFLSAPDTTTAQMTEVTGRGSWKAIYKLVKLNIKIYGNLGWQYGRWEAQRKYGVDIGPYPGVKAVTESWFKKRFR